jgi:hypothetical protein
MRHTPCRTTALALLAALTWLSGLAGLADLTGFGPASPLLAAQTATKSAKQPPQAQAPRAEATDAETANAEVIDISGRIAVGLDKVFIKDAQGYCLVQGLDLSPFAGRHIQARAVILRTDKDYRTVRLVDYRMASPDDDSPGAAKAPAPARPPKKQ